MNVRAGDGRASLQEIHSETVRGFANVAELCAYLRHQTFIDERSQSKMDEEDGGHRHRSHVAIIANDLLGRGSTPRAFRAS